MTHPFELGLREVLPMAFDDPSVPAYAIALHYARRLHWYRYSASAFEPGFLVTVDNVLPGAPRWRDGDRGLTE